MHYVGKFNFDTDTTLCQLGYIADTANARDMHPAMAAAIINRLAGFAPRPMVIDMETRAGVVAVEALRQGLHTVALSSRAYNAGLARRNIAALKAGNLVVYGESAVHHLPPHIAAGVLKNLCPSLIVSTVDTSECIDLKNNGYKITQYLYGILASAAAMSCHTTNLALVVRGVSGGRSEIQQVLSARIREIISAVASVGFTYCGHYDADGTERVRVMWGKMQKEL